MEADPRGKKYLQTLLRKQTERSKKLTGSEKQLFDEERTWNPYADSRIINGTGQEDVTHLMVGIVMETPELVLADRLRERGERIDCIMTHHPEGRALADLDKVLPLQADLLAGYGVPINVAEGQLRPRMERIWRSIHADNLFRTERAAALLGFPMFGCHTVSDNLVWQFMEQTICKKEYENLGEILRALRAIPEYADYAHKGNPPIIVHGSEHARPGRIVASEFTGGTNGPEEQLAAQAAAGVGTILSMHVTEKTLEEAKKHHVNMVQCSHMASDAIGLNLLLDRLQKAEKRLRVLPVSGFIRVERKGR
jgi:hypothetical protein